MFHALLVLYFVSDLPFLALQQFPYSEKREPPVFPVMMYTSINWMIAWPPVVCSMIDYCSGSWKRCRWVWLTGDLGNAGARWERSRFYDRRWPWVNAVPRQRPSQFHLLSLISLALYASSFLTCMWWQICACVQFIPKVTARPLLISSPAVKLGSSWKFQHVIIWSEGFFVWRHHTNTIIKHENTT